MPTKGIKSYKKYESRYTVSMVILTFTAIVLMVCNCNRSENLSEIQSIKSHHIKPKAFSEGISLEAFMLYFSGIFFSLVGLFLLSVTLWTFARKMFVYTHFMQIKVDTTFFSIPAGLLCFPSVALTILLKSNKANYMLMLFGLQLFANILLFTGYFMGMTYKLDFHNETVYLSSTIPREALNVTLYNLILNYETVPENNSVINIIQIKFQCCGISSKDNFNIVPESCCPSGDCKNFDVWPNGCLRSIQEDVAWHKHITSSLTQLFILMYFFNLAMVSSVFISDHYKSRYIQTMNNTPDK